MFPMGGLHVVERAIAFAPLVEQFVAEKKLWFMVDIAN